jgi:hypothetical protein
MTTQKIQYWVTSPEADEEFAAHMEEVIEVYHEPPDPEFPVVAMDEQPIQLLAETREIIPAIPARAGHAGHPERIDYEYERNGTASVFMFVAPFLNWRRVAVRAHRTKRDWAEEIEQLVMHDFKAAKKIRIILDNLNTHTKGALYKRYPAAYAREILDRIEFIYTPIHGSWLNIAESELSVLTHQCLCGRLANISEVRRQVSAWTTWRNVYAKGVRWQFTTDDARIKLDSVYPKFQFDNE